MALLEFTRAGIYCPEANVYIDPWRKVDKALVTHGHSDHARAGHKSYLCADSSVPILKHRLGKKINVEGISYGESKMINGVEFSFHPAGHVRGSAQIRVEYKGEIWVASGDYKTEDDGFSEPFEIVPCHTFITESTFGLPVYKWKPQQVVFEEINEWWRSNAARGITSVLGAYSLGKAQRIIANVDHSIGRIYCHDAVQKMNNTLINAGAALPVTIKLPSSGGHEELAGALVLSPSTSQDADWMRGLKAVETASASGWNQVRSRRRWGGGGRGFVLSDHADWQGLNDTISATGAETVYVTHGYTEIFSRWLSEQGYDARVEKTEFGEEEAS